MNMGSGGITGRAIPATQGLTMQDVIYLSQHGDEAQKFLADYAAAEAERAKVLAAADADRKAAADALKEAQDAAGKTTAAALDRVAEIEAEAEATTKRATALLRDVKAKDDQLRQRAAELDAREKAHRDRLATMRAMLAEDPEPEAEFDAVLAEVATAG